MPDEVYWASFFDPEVILARILGPRVGTYNLLEFGCGYGTFTLPAARYTRGRVTALDIEPSMISLVEQRAKDAGLANVHAEVRDFVAHGTGVADSSQGHAMVFNLLHIEDPLALLREAHRTLQPGGILSVIHWRSDIETPRGPPLAIRPNPAQCALWLAETGFDSVLQEWQMREPNLMGRVTDKECSDWQLTEDSCRSPLYERMAAMVGMRLTSLRVHRRKAVV